MDEVTDFQYAEALKLIYNYRTQRGLEFYLPLNIKRLGDDYTVSLEKVKEYFELQKSIYETGSET